MIDDYRFKMFLSFLTGRGRDRENDYDRDRNDRNESGRGRGRRNAGTVHRTLAILHFSILIFSSTVVMVKISQKISFCYIMISC